MVQISSNCRGVEEQARRVLINLLLNEESAIIIDVLIQSGTIVNLSQWMLSRTAFDDISSLQLKIVSVKGKISTFINLTIDQFFFVVFFHCVFTNFYAICLLYLSILLLSCFFSY